MRVKLDGLWRHPDFVRLWAAQTVSVFGSLITGTALPFTAILLLDASAFEVAVLTACRFLPGVLVGLHAGVWVDRLPRRPLMIAADIGRMLLLLTVPAAYWLDALTIEQLYAVALSTGVLTMFFDVAYRSYLPSLVERAELLEGNAKLTASESVAEFGAFSAAGWLVQIFSGPAALLVDAGTFLFSALSLGGIRAPEPPPVPAAERTTVREEAVDGLRTVWRDPVLRASAAAVVLWSFGFGGFAATYMLFVTRTLDFEPGVLGVIFGIGGVSSLAGALFAERAARLAGIGVSMIAGVTMMGLSMLFIPVGREASLLAAGMLIAQQVFGDGLFTIYQVSDTTLRQSIAPERALGRVNAFVRMVELLFTLAGIAAGGLLAEVIGLRPALTVAGLSVVAAGAWLFASPVRGVFAVAAPAVVEGMVDRSSMEIAEPQRPG